MSYDQNYPFPQVFLVDGAGDPQHPAQPPGLIPCWSFPPAQQRVRSRGKSEGCMGIRPGLALIVLLLFLLVFAALGFEAYQILKIQKELRQVKPEMEVAAPQKQIGYYEPQLSGEDKKDRPAAHVTGRIEKGHVPQTLRWESKTGQAFTSTGVAYRIEDGALQVNESGLYHIYSRVELMIKDCVPPSFKHSVFVKRSGHSPSLILMEAHKAGFCSKQSGHTWTTESFLGSALQLKKYDRVFVNVSHPTSLSHSHYGNFFGLYKI
ncbi:tumor necrosis factor ligand superfamily member 6 [Stegastes partitus]|uniref:Tumor necrosis factor ligand superfamily member 6-like n=1 Tax=Stegastes partitus TaxID=144197 RepID=A0A3B5AGF0_9TELE|nr:PREDICTED: tumor necrosis factor ligand superfamily member 6-like [Stegastes partitus]